MLGIIPPMKRRQIAKQTRDQAGIYVSQTHRPFPNSRKHPYPDLSKNEERVRKAWTQSKKL